MKHCFTCLSVYCLYTIFISCQSPAPAVYQTGFKVLQAYDSSRLFDTSRADHTGPYYRPVKIDLFYPADAQPAQPPLLFGDMLDQYEQRFNYSTPPDTCRKASLELAKIYGEYLHLDSPARLLNYPTQTYRNLPPIQKKCPLIIYTAGMNGSSYENIALFERLTRQGYVVAAISSVGLYPGFMSSPADIAEQVNDILFTRKKLQAMPFVDTAHTGLLSWSLGGTSCVKAAMLLNDIRCILSLDGTETHYYGFDTAWDRQFDTLLQLPPYSPEKVTMPYMYLGSVRSKDADSIYLFPKHIGAGERFFVQLKGAGHEDFSCMPTVVKRLQPSLADIDTSRYTTVGTLALRFFDQYLKGDSAQPMAVYIQQLTTTQPEKFSTAYPPQ